MRHSRTINHLGRTSSHRKAMLSNMAASLILHKRITTTTAKAKALRTYVEPLITKAKEDSTHSRRVAFSFLKDKAAVAELFRDVSPKVGERPGGYTRILKTGKRLGDNADMCMLELVDFNEGMLGTAEAARSKTTRRRRSSKKTGASEAEKSTPAKAEKPVKPVKAESEEKPVEQVKNEEELPAAEESEEEK